MVIELDTNDDTILPDLDMVPNGCGFDNTIGTDVYMVTYFHRIVIEVSAVRFVRWPRHEICTRRWHSG
jgi:hypothetical protein